MALTLYRLPGSHYCERVEMLLQLKKVEYARRTLSYREAATLLPHETGADTVPVLKTDDGAVVTWRDAPRWLEERHPEPALYPTEAREREDVSWWEDVADLQLGHVVRRLGFREMREDADRRRRFFRVKNPVDEARARALLAFFLNRYGSTDWTHQQDVEFMRAFLARVERALDRGDGEHLVGGRLTAADVAVAALAAPLAGGGTARALGHERAWAWTRATRDLLKPRRPDGPAAPRS